MPHPLSDRLFYSPTSDLGVLKAKMLKDHAVVVPRFTGRPSWRITWEHLQHHAQSAVQAHAAIMRTMPLGSEAADRFEQAAGLSFVELLMKTVLEIAVRNVTGYDPGHGFDLDLFLMVAVDAEANVSTAIVNEIFLRRKAGVPETAFGSRISIPGTHSWLQVPGSEDNGLQGVLFKEPIDGGAKPVDLWLKIRQHRGLWELHSEQWIRSLIERILLSILSPSMKGQKLITGRTRHVGRDDFKASVHETIL